MTTAVQAPPTTLRVQVLQENLHRALAALNPAIAKRPKLLILANVRIATVRGRLVLTATDLHQVISVTVGAKVECEGAVTVPYAALAAHVKALPPVTIALTETESASVTRGNRTIPGRLEILGGRNETSFPTWAAEDYPRIAPADGPPILFAQRFAEALAYVLPCVSRDDGHPVLAGVSLQWDGAAITLAAADGYRLAVRTVPAYDVPRPAVEPYSMIIPLAGAAAMARGARGQGCELRRSDEGLHYSAVPRSDFGTGDRHADLRYGGVLIQGTFPDFGKIIPTDPACTVTVNRAELTRSVKGAVPVVKDGSGWVRLTWTADALTVSARADEAGNYSAYSAEIDASVAYTRESSSKIAFNYRYLLDALAALPGETVSIGTDSPTAAALFTSPGHDGCYVIMPGQIQW